MRRLLLIVPLITLVACSATAAPEEEPTTNETIYVATLNLRAGTISHVRHVTRGAKGEDYQPAFVNDGRAIVFVSDRSGSSNVYRYEIATAVTTPVTATKENLYAPTPLADGSGFSAIRVITPGTGGAEMKEPPVWHYGWDGQPIAAVLDVRHVGYHAWVNERQLALFIVDQDEKRAAHTAVLADRLTGKTTLLTNKPGRTFSHTPDSKRATFVDKSDPQRWVIAAVGAEDTRPEVLVATPGGPAGQKDWERSEFYC
jgi:hypothetical protein